ncbi:uncharacterized protein LOC108145742 isoform X2 [Drosophila elegans]|uniref:uncharacterized protein LOC108145742 isoform X2 n=1 Tax=Drosophila elegans TaxID=30023 RepID=UPI001BC865EB|nr:uncharacterized protein LOC108145742 isoform X2 [Drosophila elegans]
MSLEEQFISIRKSVFAQCKRILGTFLSDCCWYEWDKKRFLMLKAPDVPESFRQIVSPDGYIHRNLFQNWFHSNFKPTNYIHLNGIQHTITLCPTLKFPWSQWPLEDPPVCPEVFNKWSWYATMSERPGVNDDRTFLIRCPELVIELTKDVKHFEEVFRTMTRLSQQINLKHINKHMIRSLMLHQISNVDWERSVKSLVAEMWTRLVDHLRAGRLDYFLGYGHNSFDCMDREELDECLSKARMKLFELLESYSIEFDDEIPA